MCTFETFKNEIMKKLIGLLIVLSAFQINAQNNSELLKHYQAYYEQMQYQGDVQGVINALTHLYVIEKKVETRDTLAVYYMNDGNHVQALNLIGVEKNDDDSNLAVEVKAVSLQALNQPAKALEHYEVLFKRNPNVLIAYELADLKIQTNNLTGATSNITYGIANSKDDIGRTYYDSQNPYQVSIRAAFTYLKAIVKYRENPEVNFDASIALLDEALKLAPNFNRAKLTKDALIAQKNAAVKQE